MAPAHPTADDQVAGSTSTTGAANSPKPQAIAQPHRQRAIHYTAVIRLPFPRGDFVDPPLVNWDASKDKRLWKMLSRNTRSADIDWKELAAEFDVSLPFILQQAAWLYERQLNQVRAQMRRVGKPSAPSPVPGSLDGQRSSSRQQTSRKGSVEGGTRIISALTGDSRELHASPVETSVPGTPKARAPPISRNTSTNTITAIVPSPGRGGKSSLRTLLEPFSQPEERPSAAAGGIQQETARTSPQQSADEDSDSTESSDSESAATNVKRSQLFRRTPRFTSGKNALVKSPRVGPLDRGQDEDEDDEDAPAFLPLSKQPTETRQDLGATIRTTKQGQFDAQAESDALESRPQQPADSSASSASSAAAMVSLPGEAATAQRPPGPLNPRQKTELAGMSPRRRAIGKDGSDGTPSMGSSFSDLDDASVTQSALEEALLSNMQRGGVSTMAQTWRSRYL